jgi:hypothetical protein
MWIAEEKRRRILFYPSSTWIPLKCNWNGPWIDTSWHDTLKKNAESFYFDSLYPVSGHPLPQK